MSSIELTSKQLEGVKKTIASFIRDSVSSADASGVVLGLSGGVDSALVAALAKEAGVNVKALLLPEEGVTPKSDIDDALSLAKKLGIEHKTIDIKPIVSGVIKQSGGKFSKEATGNVKARARMIVLYLHANSENRLVLGTGNKTELLLGYFTKHGDGGADILPIGGLYKTQVRQLAKTMGVPEKIIDKIPSAGLWEGQTDEGEIGLPYKKIDETLSLLYDVVMPEEAVALECDLPSNKVSALAARVARNRHKTRTPPIADLSEITG